METSNDPDNKAPVAEETQHSDIASNSNSRGDNRGFGRNNANNFQGGQKRRTWNANGNQHRNFNNRRSLGNDNNGEGNERGYDRPNDMASNNLRRVMQAIAYLEGPVYDLPPLDTTEKPFNGRNRLYVGNLPNDITEEEVVALFKPFGEVKDFFQGKDKNFVFLRIDYRVNAEKARKELDGTVLKGRNLKLRFAPNNSSVKVKNLSPFVSNEVLEYAFAPFGEIEETHVSVDARGKPTGEGYVHFVNRYSAKMAVDLCSQHCYFLTSTMQPVIVEYYEVVDDVDGLTDKNINKKSQDFLRDRHMPPRVAEPASFEEEYGNQWKTLYQTFQQKEEALKKEFELEKEKLNAQMSYARYEHETEMLRRQLQEREMDKERQKKEWEEKQRMVDEERTRQQLRWQNNTDQKPSFNRSSDQTNFNEQRTNLFQRRPNNQEQNSLTIEYAEGAAGQDGSKSRGGDSGWSRWENPRNDDFSDKRRRF